MSNHADQLSTEQLMTAEVIKILKEVGTVFEEENTWPPRTSSTHCSNVKKQTNPKSSAGSAATL